MKLNVASLNQDWKTFNIAMSCVDCERTMALLAVQDINLQARVKVKYQDKTVLLKADYNYNLIRSCDLCLEDNKITGKHNFEVQLISDIDNQFLAAKTQINDLNSEIDTYQGNIIDINKQIEDDLILELDQKYNCSQNCQGLCEICGQNLNKINCNCQQ